MPTSDYSQDELVELFLRTGATLHVIRASTPQISITSQHSGSWSDVLKIRIERPRFRQLVVYHG